MVAHVVQLRLTALGSSWRHPRSGSEVLGRVLGAIVIIAVIAGIGQLVIALWSVPIGVATAFFVPFGALLLAAASLSPLISGFDSVLDPRRYATLGVTRGTLARSLPVAAMMSPPMLLLAVFIVASVIRWFAVGFASGIVALLGGAIALALAALAAAISSRLAGAASDTKSARNIGSVVVSVIIAAAAPLLAIAATTDWGVAGLAAARGMAQWLSWTPLGAPWAAPAAAAQGDTVSALGQLAVALVTVGVLWVIWWVCVTVAVSTVPQEREARGGTRLGVFALLPATAAGAITARTLVYWIRDPRYSFQMVLFPLVPLVIVGVAQLSGVSPEITAWIPVPLVCLMIGSVVHNDVAMDSHAFMGHVLAGVNGLSDRWARVVAPLLLGVPVAIGGSVLTAWIMQDQAMLLPLISLSVCALLTALGIASLFSAVFPYRTTAPGDSAFAQPQVSTDGATAIQVFALLIPALLTAGVGALVVFGQLGDASLGSWAVPAGFAVGGFVFIVGLAIGGAVVSRRGPELLAFIEGA